MGGQRTGFFRFDGHRIAFATVGEGPPLVFAAWCLSNILEEWKYEEFRRWLQALARGRQVIRYDHLGCGLSDRDRPRETLTLDYEVATLAALVDHLALERLSLFGGSIGGCTAVAYAVRNRERVDRVVLYGTYADGAEIAHAEVRQALVDLVRRHWVLGSRMLADVFVPSEADREAVASAQRLSAAPDTVGDLIELMYAIDISEVLPELRTPTLVLHRRHDRAIPLRAGEHVAALAPNAELVVLEGDSHLPWVGGAEAVLRAIAPFLGIAAPLAETPTDVEALSPRERDILRLVAQGLSDTEIAAQLVLSPHTVHRHVANILRKLNLHSRAAAAAHAARAGIV